MQLELRYIADLSDDVELKSRWYATMARFRGYIAATNKKGLGLYPISILESGNLTSLQTSKSRYFYDYLAKSYLQSNGTDTKAATMFRQAMVVAAQNGLFARSNKSELYYVRDANTTVADSPILYQEMKSEGCALGAVLSLADRVPMLLNGSQPFKSNSSFSWTDLAKAITKTCHIAAISTKTGMLPRLFHFAQAHGVPEAIPDFMGSLSQLG